MNDEHHGCCWHAARSRWQRLLSATASKSSMLDATIHPRTYNLIQLSYCGSSSISGGSVEPPRDSSAENVRFIALHASAWKSNDDPIILQYMAEEEIITSGVDA